MEDTLTTPEAAAPAAPMTPVDTQETGQTTEAADPATKDVNDKIVKRLRTESEASKRMRDDYRPKWRRNIAIRMGQDYGTPGYTVTQDDLQSEINPDWALTKTKVANLYSQVPQVQGTHVNPAYVPAISPFMKQVNYELSPKRTNIGAAMYECMNDVVNAAGICGIIAGYSARFEFVEVPATDTIMLDIGPVPVDRIPPDQQQLLARAGILQMKTAPRVVCDKFFAKRISPEDLLLQSSFKGSNYDDSDWIGHTGSLTWAEALNEWQVDGKPVLKETDKENVVSDGKDRSGDSLQVDNAYREDRMSTEKVFYDEIYYWRHRFDPDEKYFTCIWKCVFVRGKKEPVYHGPWTEGQKLVPVPGSTRQEYIGATRFPVQVKTLTYISDNPIPPSDSQAGRPQVTDMRRSRATVFLNRARSSPLRWHDVNRVDPLVQIQLMRGEVQASIPVNGDGARAIGEIARASYPSEDFTFDAMTKTDLHETWRLGPNQLGGFAGSRATKGESENVQENFATGIGEERARIGDFFLAVVEVLAGLIALHSEFPILSPQEKQAMVGAWDSKRILHDLVMTIRPDSTIMLDVNSRIERVTKFLNMTVKSGYVNPKPLIIELAELSGVDPAEVVVDPPPPKDDQNISYRFSGKDDLSNITVMSLLVKNGQAPEPKDMDQAEKILRRAQATALVAPPAGPPGAEGAPGPLPPGPARPATPPGVEDAHPNWQLASTVAKRQRDI